MEFNSAIDYFYISGMDRTIPGYDNLRMEGNEALGEYHLVVQNARLEDDAMYQCQVTPSLVALAYVSVISKCACRLSKMIVLRILIFAYSALLNFYPPCFITSSTQYTPNSRTLEWFHRRGVSHRGNLKSNMYFNTWQTCSRDQMVPKWRRNNRGDPGKDIKKHIS